MRPSRGGLAAAAKEAAAVANQKEEQVEGEEADDQGGAFGGPIKSSQVKPSQATSSQALELTFGPIRGLGETSLVADGRGPATLTLFSRAGSAPLLNHAIATSEDGGQTWSEPLPLDGVVGPTCEGSIGRRPPPAMLPPSTSSSLATSSPASPHAVLVSAPHSTDGGLGGRENLALWSVELPAAGLNGTNTSSLQSKLVGRLWGCKGAYSAFSEDGTYNLFEAGETYRYRSIMLAHLNSSTATGTA